MNQVKVKIVGGKGVRLVDGRSPDVVVNIRLKQFDSFVCLRSLCIVAAAACIHAKLSSCKRDVGSVLVCRIVFKFDNDMPGT